MDSTTLNKYLCDKQHINDNYKNAYNYFLKYSEIHEKQKEISIEYFDSKMRELIYTYSYSYLYSDDVRDAITELRHLDPRQSDMNIILLYQMLIQNNDIIGFEMLYNIYPKKIYDFYVEERPICIDCCRDDAETHCIYDMAITVTMMTYEMIEKMFLLSFIDNKDVELLVNILKSCYEWSNNGDYIINIFMNYDIDSLIEYRDIHSNNILTLLVCYLSCDITNDKYVDLLNKLYKNGCKVECVMRECQLMLPHDIDLIKEDKYKYDNDMYDYDGMNMPKRYDDYICVRLYKKHISFNFTDNEFYYEYHNCLLTDNEMNDMIKIFHGDREADIAILHLLTNKKLAIIYKFERLMLKLKKKVK